MVYAPPNACLNEIARMASDVLFTPFEIKGLRLKNRIVMAPMTRSHSPGGVATEDVAQYYRRRAEGEVGLIVSEGTGVDRPASLNDPNVPRFHGEAELAAWKRVIDEVHAAGGVMAPQLWHVGAVKTRHEEWTPPGPYDSPSGLSRPEKPFGEAMTEEEVADAVRAFAEAAGAAKRLGFDSIELHGAHGYLIDQFFWDGTNRREEGRGAGLSGDHPHQPVEAAGLRREAGADAEGTGALAGRARRCRGRRAALLAAAVLGAGVRGLGPQLRRVGQEADRRADDHRGLGGPEGRVHRRLRGGGLGAGLAGRVGA
jgi:hypothetical protein